MDDKSGVVLMSIVNKQNHATKDGSPSAYTFDNQGFQLPEDSVPEVKIINDNEATTSTSSNETAVAAPDDNINHTYSEVKDVDEETTAATNLTNGPVDSGEKGPGLPNYRRKESSVGFRLPAAERKASTASHSAPFRGMGKEELLRHSAKPFWRRLRYVCMSIVLVGWLALIITVVALVLVYPSCRKPVDQQWWQKAVVYRIYVRSFQDSNGDGIGDLKGVNYRLDYLKELGVNTISLSPIYETSPQSESDMDIVNHTSIHKELGTLDDFISLVNNSNERGIKVILDFIPNLTSKNHTWFRDSASSADTSNLKRNYYVWVEGHNNSAHMAPNNWISVYDGSAWSFDASRSMFYLHNFLTTQPELNLRSSGVKKELTDVMQFWLDLGVDGFFIRNSGYLFQDYDLRDESLLPNKTDDKAYSSYDHAYTYGLSEIHDMFARWRAFLDDYGNTSRHDYIVLLADRVGSSKEVLEYYGRFNRDGVNLPLNNFCLDLDEYSGGHGVAQVVRQWIKSMPAGRWANWLGGIDTSPRLIDRMGEAMARPFLTLAMLMPGTPVVYYGDEIGMRGHNSSQKDEGQRNLPMRTPMQWDATENAASAPAQQGARGCPSTPRPPQSMWSCPAAQKSEDDSLYNLFTNLTALRADNPAFHYGDYNEAVVDDQVFSFVRDYDGVKGFLVALNFVNQTVTKSFCGAYSTIASQGEVVLVTSSDVIYKKGNSVSCSGVQLGPYQGLVMSWNYAAKEL
ncbi:maltase A2-like [Pomacea canaliculata]|uniref:maltase A2-like n=1 Tax=Pomacea canaliculata TaxID=400727 RepID=UPI000D73138A|nr:maltase A2-like [Pomacea canaliculata]